MISFLYLWLILLGTIYCAPSKIPKLNKDVGYRLPNNTEPISYDLTLKTLIDESNFEFEGDLSIKIFVKQESSEIVLHSRDLVIDEIELCSEDKLITYELSDLQNSTEQHFLTIPIDGKTINIGIYFLEIKYHGTIREDTIGFYRSSYNNENGDVIWLATTQFEPLNARYALPCYDEPGRKVPFTLTIEHALKHHALSNTPATRTELADKAITTFETTPPMSTYLLAFVISNFPSKDDLPENHRIFARPTAIDDAKFALKSSVLITKALEEYLQVDYSLAKMDQVAIPDKGGAMENWGLVLYGEEYLLIHESSATKRQIELVGTTISHELAHQWFGNLVGPDWWTNIWLNEGFATFFEFVATDAVFPEWNIIDMFVVEVLQSVFQSDAFETTRPITQYAENPTAVSALFDNIIYGKAGCVIRMMMNAIGESTFKKGLTNYLLDRYEKQAVDDDLYRNMQKSVNDDSALPNGITVSDLWSSWNNQAGYPVLFVQASNQKLDIQQKRFFLKPQAIEPTTTWWIPINVATKKNSDFTETSPNDWILNTEFHEFQLTQTIDTKNGDWVILNKQETGFYRVNYNSENWMNIIEALKSDEQEEIHRINRAQLIDDSFNLARAGELLYNTPLQLIQYLSKERNFIPWNSANAALNYLNIMMNGNPIYDNFKKYVNELVHELYIEISASTDDDESNFDVHLRNIAIKWACLSGSLECHETSLKNLEKFIETPDAISPDLKASTICEGIRYGNTEEFQIIWDSLDDTENQADRRVILESMGCSEDETVVKLYLESTLNDKFNYRKSELNIILKAVYSNGHVGLNIALDFLTTNYETVYERYNGNKALSQALVDMARYIVDDDHNRKFSSILILSESLIGLEVVNAAKGILEENIHWLDNYSSEISSWIEDYYNSAVNTVLSSTCLLLSFVLILWSSIV